ncbi:MAG: hypothetical protein ACTS3R_21400 [Inquilinaceae bacterium]
MNDPENVVPGPSQGDPQPLIGYRTNAEWNDLIAQTGAMIGALESIEDQAVRDEVFGALAAIDAVHREALHRLVRLFKEGVLEQVVTDPAIRSLMGMYDLLPETQPACQKVWDFTKDDPASADSAVAAGSMDDPPHWSLAPVPCPPKEGEALICHMEEGTYVLVGAGGRTYAFDAVCGVHLAPMLQGKLETLSWICPHGPGCIYDVRNGTRLGGDQVLDCRPVKTDATGRVLIGFGLPFEPSLPAF